MHEWLDTWDAAYSQWLRGVAKGRLGVVKVEGRDDRLTMDSTVPGVNPVIKAQMREKGECPSILDI